MSAKSLKIIPALLASFLLVSCSGQISLQSPSESSSIGSGENSGAESKNITGSSGGSQQNQQMTIVFLPPSQPPVVPEPEAPVPAVFEGTNE